MAEDEDPGEGAAPELEDVGPHHRSREERAQHRRAELQRLRAAAIEAELETGRREETPEQARAGVIRRLIRICIGSFLLVVGVLLLVLPGPGWLMIAIGLGILARDVAWAERLLERVRDRLPEDEEGNVPKPIIITSVALALAAAAASLWLAFR
jgi:uncharacterized protein (TIGR02611 family)